MLHGMLQANDLMLDFLRSYLRHSLAIFEQIQQPAHLSPFMATMEWMRAMLPPTLPFGPSRPTGSLPIPSRHAELDARISEIERRLERLEQPSLRDGEDSTSPLPDERQSAEEGGASLERLEQRLSALESGTDHSAS
jgi:hypothetical protein